MVKIERTIQFAVNDVEIQKDINDMFFKKVRIKAFATGPNAHTLPIDEDVLKRGAVTVYNKPILWKYNKNWDDAMGHEYDEVPCGFVWENEDNPVVFEQTDDGRTFMVINALLWTKYTGRLIDIFERDGGRKDVSIEIVALDSDESGSKPRIKDFIIAGITILGEMVRPAVEGAEAVLVAFSEDKEKCEELLMAESIKINNTKDAAVSGSWANPRGKLANPIKNASNTGALFKEAYLVNNSFDSDSPMSDHKYPHHVIRDGELVIHIRGVQTAYARAKQQGIFKGGVKAHIERHYRELGLNTDNFSEFGLTDLEFEDFNRICNESAGDKALETNRIKGLLDGFFSDFIFEEDNESVAKYEVNAFSSDAVFVTDIEDGTEYEIKYAVNVDNIEVDMSNMIKMTNTYVETAVQLLWLKKEEDRMEEELAEAYSDESGVEPVDMVNKTDEDHDGVKETTEMAKKVDKDHDGIEETTEMEHKVDEDHDGIKETTEMCDDVEEMSFEDMKAKLADLEDELKRERASLEAYMSENTELKEKMTEFEELKAFRDTQMEKERIEIEMSEMLSIISEIEQRNIEMSEDQKAEYINKRAEFSDISLWANFVKSHVFDSIESTDGIVRIANVSRPEKIKTSGSGIWDFEI